MRWAPSRPLASVDAFYGVADNARFPVVLSVEGGALVCDANTNEPPPPTTALPVVDRSTPQAAGLGFLEAWIAGDVAGMEARSEAGVVEPALAYSPAMGQMNCFVSQGGGWQCDVNSAAGRFYVVVSDAAGAWTVTHAGQAHGEILDP
jgi:hypothetical protein